MIYTFLFDCEKINEVITFKLISWLFSDEGSSVKFALDFPAKYMLIESKWKKENEPFTHFK